MVATRCPACGDEAGPATLTVKEMMYGRDERFEYAECCSCGTLWLVEVPADLGEYYPSDYYSLSADPTSTFGRRGVRQIARIVARSQLFGSGRLARAARRTVRVRQFRTFLGLLDSVSVAAFDRGSATRVLDVGCGSGQLLYVLSVAGVQTAVGVDPFASADRTFDTGARVLRRELSEVEGQFDLIMFHHSFEHVLDPAESLVEACRLLAPGGQILIRMPTRSSAAFDQYGPDWVQLDAPRHLTIFSRSGVEILARRHQLQVVAVSDDSSGFQFWASEQARRGIALAGERSLLVAPDKSPFTSEQIEAWEQQAALLNDEGRGDQAIWVLGRA